jgi:mono/diheme cytochrome c family protein
MIAATYVAFLLFAQFGFLSQAQRELIDAGRVRFVMGAMGVAGLAASLGTAWLLGRVPGPRLIRIGLAGVAAVAAVSVVSHGLPALTAVAAGIGGALGLLTVAVAASLPEIVPRRSMGLAAGLGTGAAYFVSNIPALFEAAPVVRALFPAALALVALALVPQRVEPEPVEDDSPGPVRLLVIFLVLIWLDSAAFAVVQAAPALKDQTWGSAAQKLVQGSVHLLAAAGAGALLDAGVFLAIPLAAWGLFAVAFPLLQAGGGEIAGPLYAVGISFYSTALVVAPSRGASPSPRWRAGLLFGVAGWIGSALGVGMAQDLGRIPAWFLVVTGVALAAATARMPRLRLHGPALALGAVGIAVIMGVSLQPQPEGSAEARGRQVYIEEGCIHCHSQYVRPGTRDVWWWGPARPIDRGERPPLVGVRRQGPDLLEIGNRRGEAWQEAHLRDPRALNPGSRMPSYAYLFEGDGRRGRDLVAYLMSLGASTAVERWTLTGAEAVPSLTGSADRGRVLFARYCAVCHGAEGRGDGPLAAKLNDPKTNLRKARFASLRPGPEPEAAALFRVIRHGLPPTSMPGHEWLTDRQVSDLVAWVQTLRKEPR